MWRSIASFLVDYPNFSFHFYDRPIFWLSTLVTAPTAFLMNRRRRIVWGDDWRWQRTKALSSLVIPIVMIVTSLFVRDQDGFLAWLAGMALFDSFARFIGPEYPADPLVEWVVHKLLKRPLPQGMLSSVENESSAT